MKRLSAIGVCFAALVFSSCGYAADLPVKAPAVPFWSWSGFYFGSHAGAAWSPTDWRNADGALAPPTGYPFDDESVIGGKFAGVQAGYNWQHGSLVYGVELSGDWADIDGNAKCEVAEFICHTKIDWFGTATGRLGWASDHVLYYAKGGFALAHDKHHMDGPFFSNVLDGSSTRTGWTAGTGLEYAFTPAWSGFAEYDYMGFGTKTVDMTDQFGNLSHVGINQDIQVIKLGLNYRPSNEGRSFAGGRAGFVKAPMLSDWTTTAGMRVWYSAGKVKKDLYDPFVTTQLNSRLTYGPEDGVSVEGFARFDHVSGLFAKGFLGFGALTSGGTLLDEDFPPGLVPYSATTSQMHDGKFRYGGLDVGHTVARGAWGSLGPFVGYRFYYQQSNGFGCAQVATSGMCGTPIPTKYLGLTETQAWRGVAVGLNGRFNLTDRIMLAADMAYLPYVNLSGYDNHWFRADINPQVENGHGWGTQLQAIVSYALTNRWSIGIGGRYWYFKTTDAATRFPDVTNLSPMTFTAERYGGFLQTSYKFGASDAADRTGSGIFKASASEMATNWTGFYVGGHVGGGFGTEDWNSATNTLAISNPLFPASSELNGLLAGGQIGYNYQVRQWVLGAEADANWADFYSDAKCAVFTGPKNGICNAKISSLGSFTGRLGYAVGRFLYYGKAGVAWSNVDYSIQSMTVGPLNYSGSATRWGWTAGSGIAYALTPHWSIDAEYDYISFGNHDVTMNDPLNGASTVNIGQRVHLFTLGANYKFHG